MLSSEATEQRQLSGRLVVVAALAGALGVLIGAFGAHLLPGHLEASGLDPETTARRMSQFDVGARYHLVHSVALLGVAAIEFGSVRWRKVAALLFVLGLLFFSGSLYLLVMTNQTKLGMVTPIGGVLWIFGWLSLIRVKNS